MRFDEFINNSNNLHLLRDIQVSEHLKYHLDNQISIRDNIFRIYSEGYFALIEEARILYFENILAVDDDDADLLESDLGKRALFEDREVYLDAPIFLEEDLILEEKSKKQGKHKLNSPFRTPSGPKKFAVYVKSKSGGVKKVTFGDPNLRVKNDNPTRARSFRARHKCHLKKDRTTPGYWSCNISRYRKALGLKSSRAW
jgi:hypothetical protein